MRARFSWSLSWAIPLLLVSSGCVSLAKSFPDKRFYALDVARQGEPLATVSGTVLRIERFRVSSRFEGKEMVYRMSDTRYESDFYNEWFVSPNTMVTQQAQNWLLNAGLFESVVDSSSDLDTTHILEGAVTALYGDYRYNGSPKAVLDLRVMLITDEPRRAEIVFRREYHQTVDLTEASPDTLAKGCNEALLRVFESLEKDLKQVGLRENRLKPASGP